MLINVKEHKPKHKMHVYTHSHTHRHNPHNIHAMRAGGSGGGDDSGGLSLLCTNSGRALIGWARRFKYFRHQRFFPSEEILPLDFFLLLTSMLFDFHRSALELFAAAATLLASEVLDTSDGHALESVAQQRLLSTEEYQVCSNIHIVFLVCVRQSHVHTYSSRTSKG